jgi:hypothetical protein
MTVTCCCTLLREWPGGVKVDRVFRPWPANVRSEVRTSGGHSILFISQHSCFQCLTRYLSAHFLICFQSTIAYSLYRVQTLHSCLDIVSPDQLVSWLNVSHFFIGVNLYYAFFLIWSLIKLRFLSVQYNLDFSRSSNRTLSVFSKSGHLAVVQNISLCDEG